jgi:hypothetical protein
MLIFSEGLHGFQSKFITGLEGCRQRTPVQDAGIEHPSHTRHFGCLDRLTRIQSAGELNLQGVWTRECGAAASAV